MTNNVVGVLLAGGLARRMGGGDKGLKTLAGKPILEHVIERARPQVSALVLNANGPPERFAEFGLPIAEDVIDGHAGPLAGVLTGLDWAAREAADCDWVASFACDAPFLPGDLVRRLLAAVEGEGADMACAASLDRSHPVFGLWPVRLRDELRRAMLDEEIRKVDVWTARYKLITVRFRLIEMLGGSIDPFFNANRPDDLQEAERLLQLALD